MPLRRFDDREKVSLLADCRGIQRQVLKRRVVGEVPHSAYPMHRKEFLHALRSKQRIMEEPGLIGEPEDL